MMIENTAKFDPTRYTDEERLNSMIPGDPVSAYSRFRDVQLDILAEEKRTPHREIAPTNEVLGYCAGTAIRPTVELVAVPS